MCTVYKPELHAARVYIQMAKAWTMYVTSISGNVEHDVVYRGLCYGSRLSLRYLSNSCSKKEVDSRTLWTRRSSSATKQLRGQNVLLSTSTLAMWIAPIPQRKLSITDLFLLFPGCAQNKHQRFSQLWRWYYCYWQCYTIWKCSWRWRIGKQNRPFCYWWFIRKWRLWQRLLYCGGTINGFIRLCCWHPVYKPVSVRLSFCKSS